MGSTPWAGVAVREQQCCAGCKGRVVLTQAGPAPSNPSWAEDFPTRSGRVRAEGSMLALLALSSPCRCPQQCG